MILDVKVLRVVDGDTYDAEADVSVLNPEQPTWRGRIRCAGYNAPERGKPGYAEATNRLRELLAGSQVRITMYGRDDWKRVIAETYTETGEAVSEAMLLGGFGVPVRLHVS